MGRMGTRSIGTQSPGQSGAGHSVAPSKEVHDQFLTAKYTIDLEAQDHKVHCNKLFNIGENSLHLEYYLERLCIRESVI